MRGRTRTVPMPNLEPPATAGSPRRWKCPAGQPPKERDYLWHDFWTDPAVRKARRRILLKACCRLEKPGSAESDLLLYCLRTNDDSPLEDSLGEPWKPSGAIALDLSIWEMLSVNLAGDLRSELSATVEVPTLTRAQRRKTLTWVAKLRREQSPNYEAIAAFLERGADRPAGRKKMADRRHLSRWAKRLTGSYCDAEVAALLTAARRQCGYRNPRVLAAALKQDRCRNPRQYSLKPQL